MIHDCAPCHAMTTHCRGARFLFACLVVCFCVGFIAGDACCQCAEAVPRCMSDQGQLCVCVSVCVCVCVSVCALPLPPSPLSHTPSSSSTHLLSLPKWGLCLVGRGAGSCCCLVLALFRSVCSLCVLFHPLPTRRKTMMMMMKQSKSKNEKRRRRRTTTTALTTAATGLSSLSNAAFCHTKHYALLAR